MLSKNISSEMSFYLCPACLYTTFPPEANYVLGKHAYFGRRSVALTSQLQKTQWEGSANSSKT